MTLHVSKLKNNRVSFNKIENMSETHKTNQEVINQFLSGQDPMEKNYCHGVHTMMKLVLF